MLGKGFVMEKFIALLVNNKVEGWVPFQRKLGTG